MAGDGVGGDCFWGGRWRLLEAIDRTGSLSAAAETLGVSYRKAWGDIRKTERTLGVALLERHRGGKDGGATRLTEEGRKWVREYDRFHRQVDKAVHLAYESWRRRMNSAGEGRFAP